MPSHRLSSFWATKEFAVNAISEPSSESHPIMNNKMKRSKYGNPVCLIHLFLLDVRMVVGLFLFWYGKSFQGLSCH